MSRVDLAKLDFFDPKVLECPFDVYKQVQEEAPVHRLPDTDIFLVTRHADVRQVIRDPTTYSSNFGDMLKASFCTSCSVWIRDGRDPANPRPAPS